MSTIIEAKEISGELWVRASDYQRLLSQNHDRVNRTVHDMVVAQRDCAVREILETHEELAQLVEAMGMQGYGTLAIAAAIRKGKA